MPAAKERRLGLALAALAALAAAALPAGASIPRPGDQLLEPDHEALLAAPEASPDAPQAEATLLGTRFELLAPVAVDRLLFTGRPPWLHLFAELETRVRASDLLSFPQPLEIEELTPEIAAGDRETGLYYAKARYYDPELGLFLTQDPFEGVLDTPPSLHRYLYAYQNPTVYVDPTGRETEETAEERIARLQQFGGILREGEEPPPGTVLTTDSLGLRIVTPISQLEDSATSQETEEEELAWWERVWQSITEDPRELKASMESFEENFKRRQRERMEDEPGNDLEAYRRVQGQLRDAEDVAKNAGKVAVDVVEYTTDAKAAGTFIILVKDGIERRVRRAAAKKFLEKGWEVADDDVARGAARELGGTSERAAARGTTEGRGGSATRSRVGGYRKAPDEIEGFEGLSRSKPKTPVQGGGGLRRRWKDPKGKIYEWDSRHGTLEVYNKRGKHLGEFDPTTGKQLKPADPTRTVEPQGEDVTMYATWVIRGFEKRGDKLVAEHSIGQVPLADVQKALQISSEDPMYDSYRLGPAEVLRLKDFIPQTLDFGELEYFLERE